MLGLPATVDIQLLTDAYGAIRVGGTRVLLDVIIVAFQAGATPEEIAQKFPRSMVTPATADESGLAEVSALVRRNINNRSFLRAKDRAPPGIEPFVLPPADCQLPSSSRADGLKLAFRPRVVAGCQQLMSSNSYANSRIH